MAEIIIPPVLQVILEKLSDPLFEMVSDIYNQKEHLKQIRQALLMVQAVLEDADGRQVADKVVRIWLSDLKLVVYEVEDLLESLLNLSNFEQVQQAFRIKAVLGTLQKAAEEGLKLNLKQRSEVDIHLKNRETSSFVIGSEVNGREEEKMQMVKLLTSSSSSDTFVGDVPVIPIFGTPGIGKTTLAQLVYNDHEVKKYFTIRIWVFVSHQFSVKKIVKAAIESASGKKCKISNLDGLQSKLWNTLCNKRYLLVLDDVWNEDEIEWDKLRPLFGAGVHGSKILVTTRSQKVAMMVDTQNLGQQLKGLPESSCWDLFKTRAFSQGTESKNHNLMLIGKEIVRKCGGVPLAIKTLGSLMRFKKEEREWLYIRDSELWNLDAYQTGIFPALQLSYNHLPSNLKRCFSFCSIFPRNYEIKKESIIHMWMAHDLILSDGGNKQLEDIGNEYFNELLWLSFFKDVKDSETNSVYKIDELFHSLAHSAMKSESVILEGFLSERNYKNIRHASCVSGYRGFTFPDTLFQASRLRTLLIFSEGGIQEFPSKIFSEFTYLRVLYMSHSVQMPHISINRLVILRYLDLSYSHIALLPETIALMCSLVTLNLSGCYNLLSLPDMGKLTDLRHLNIRGCEALTAMPDNIRKLNRLQTLPIFIVSTKSTPSKGEKTVVDADLSVLEFLELRGELKVKHLERVSSTVEAKAANLRNKKYIDSLGLCWGHEGADTSMDPALKSSMVRLQESTQQIPEPYEKPESSAAPCDPIIATEVLESLEPHDNLKNLLVVEYPGIKFPHWRLPNLTKVVLMKCRGCLQLPTLGELPSLRSLRMEQIYMVEYIGQEFYGENVAVFFPSLEELFMQDFPLLKEWSSLDGQEMFPKLRKFTLKKCPKLILVPSFMSVQHLRLHGCSMKILRCMATLTSLLSLHIQEFDDLFNLSRQLFRNNHLLEHLKIISCPKLGTLGSMECLTSLRSLVIRWCAKLDLLHDFQNLTALESLEISDCHNLLELPINSIGGLGSLRTLSLENCTSLASITLGLKYLTSLEVLTIMYCPSLRSLPHTVKYLSALRSLTILSCPKIQFLPKDLQNVITLQSLEIRSCPKLDALPEWIKSLSSLRSLAISDCPCLTRLPDAVQHLTKLQHLSIQDCPHLQERCKPNTGVDWWKIRHVPYTNIFLSQSQEATEGASSSN